MAVHVAEDRLLRSKDAAEYLNRSPGTLANWRCQGTGPRFTGSGAGIRYRLSELDAWIKANTRTATR
ncbi:helix-turn-helix domain-containing protein [Spirillospora sp. NBC_00431]